MNYEHKRNQSEGDRQRVIKQKVKNFKLKFSRMLTCYGSIATIISAPSNSSPSDIINLLSFSPYDRLMHATQSYVELKDQLSIIATQYQWFLEQTNVTEDQLNARFADKALREDAFSRAEVFGDAMFEVIKFLGERTGYLRYLII